MYSDVELFLMELRNRDLTQYRQGLADMQAQIDHLEEQLQAARDQVETIRSRLTQSHAHAAGLTAQLVAVANQLKAKDPNNFLFQDSGKVWEGGMHKGQKMGQLGVVYVKACDKSLSDKGIKPDRFREWYI